MEAKTRYGAVENTTKGLKRQESKQTNIVCINDVTNDFYVSLCVVAILSAEQPD
jgi:hypothetical protein